MKFIKKIMCLCLSLVFVFALGLPTFAAELAGDAVVDCNVTLMMMVTDESYSGGSIKVHFKDVTGTAEEDVEIAGTTEDWLVGITTSVVLPAPTTYNISFEGLPEGYGVLDILTGEPIATKFAATENGKEFLWTVAPIKAESQEPMSESQGAAVSRENVTVGNEEAEAVYMKFLEAVAFIEKDESWSNGNGALLRQYGKNSINQKTYSEWYADYVEGGSVEEYFAMTRFEQFLWTETYTRFANGLNSNWGYDHYYGDKDSFKSNITNHVTNLMRGNNSDTVIEAYLALADWQYNYVIENSVPFNFISNRSYMAEVQDAPAIDETEDDEEITEEEIAEMQEAIEGNQDVEAEAVEGAEAADDDEENGIWSNTLDALASNALSITILIIVAISVFAIVRVKKSKNIDDAGGNLL